MSAPRGRRPSVVAFITGVTLAVLAFVWLGRRQQAAGAVDVPSIVPAFFVALTRRSCSSIPRSASASPVVYGAAFIVAMWSCRSVGAPAIALLHAAGAATALVFIRNAFSGTSASTSSARHHV